MHQLISMMFSLLVLIGLQVNTMSAGMRSERSTDRHYISELTVSNGGSWGSWGEREMCPGGTYAAGFSLKVEDRIDGDDTALNGIRLHCVANFQASNSHRDYSSVQSAVGSWGQWTGIYWCLFGFLTAFELKVEFPQGLGDDTAANNIRFSCAQLLLQSSSPNWGDWGSWGGFSSPCRGKGICGIQTRVEGPQGQGDDTALNDVRMFCCA